jgi:hypothetical protein
MSTHMWILALLIGCGGKSRPLTSGKRTSEGNYDVGKPGAGWARVAPGGADRAWFHSTIGASIYIDSNCQARFEDKPLSALVTHLTFGMAQGDPVSEERLTLDGRTALMRVNRGTVDGVKVQIAAVVIKKNRCIYDALYISSPSGFDTGLSGFQQVILGFET